MSKYYLLIILFFSLIISELNDKLIFVMTHFRHGARSPSIINGVDNIGERWEFDSELTGVGERMLYLLGLRNRLRYIKEYKFLSEKYNVNELLIISSNRKRTVVSLSSYLQGLYPQSEKLGNNLTEVQLKNGNPPVNVSNPRIEKEKNELKNNSLPNSMTLIPFETLDIENINICIRSSNYSRKILSVSLIQNEFNEKYKDYINKFKESNNTNYAIRQINSICEPFIANYIDGRNMSNLTNIGINKDEFYKFCLKSFNVSFGEASIYTFEDELIYIRGNYYMGLLVNYTKMAIDQDLGKNISSVSKIPKTLIISGHDNTVSKHEIFLIFAFGKTFEFYRYPTFASQIAFEIKRKDDNKTNRNYSDYFINYYFNDELLLNMTVTEFLNKVEPHIWTDQEINDYCNYDNSKNKNKTKEENNTDNQNSDEINNKTFKYFIPKNNKNHTTPLIIFTTLFGISILGNIFLIVLLTRKNTDKNIATSVQRNYENSNSHKGLKI